MKKLFVALLFVISLSLPSHADVSSDFLTGPKKIVAVFIEVMQTPYGANEGIKTVTERISEVFPAEKFALVPLEKSMRELTYWKEDNLFPMGEYVTVRAPREGLIESAKKIGDIDYIATIIISSALPTYAAGFGSVAQRQTVMLDIRIMDPVSGEYITSAKVEASEKGKTGVGNTIGNYKIFIKTLNSALDQIKLDVSEL